MSTPAIAPAFIPASVKRRKNVWYTTSDGNWTNPAIWESNAVKRWNYPGQNIATPILPQVGDDVYINHVVSFFGNIFIPTNNFTYINNLYVSGTLKNTNAGSTFVLTINGDFQVTGTLDCTSGTGKFILLGMNNSIVNFLSGGTMSFNKLGDQYILPLSYTLLTTTGSGSRYLPSTGLIAGNFISAVQLYALGSGNIIIGTGQFSINAALNFSINPFTAAPTNPNVEIKGNLVIQGFINTSMGTGTWTFSTNNQTILVNSGTGAPVIFTNIVVQGAITLSNTSTGIFQVDTLDGTVPGSAFVNKGALFLNSTTAPMATGTFDKDSFDNKIGYVFNGAHTLPYTTYSSLEIRGTGTKSLSANTVLSAALSINTSGVLELSTFNLTVTTTTNISSTIQKSGSGSLIFIGLLAFSSGSVLSFPGNPTVELRGGCSGTFSSTSTGSGLWTLSTSNQVFSITPTNFDAPILISGAITITATLLTITSINNYIDGNNAGSKWDNRGITNYKFSTQPMVTGLLECNAAANTFRYNKTGAQDVKGGTYRTIEFGGSGVKTLQGNVIINVTAGGSQSTTGTASVNLNGFTITTI